MLKKSVCICLLILLFAAISSYANVPQLINYQGQLTAKNNKPLDGTVSILFSIYDAETNGNMLWSETQTVNVVDGIFSVLLGSVTSIQTSVFNGDDRYLALKVGNDSEMTPRKRLVSVGYSFLANNSDKLNGKESSAYVQSVNNVSPNSSGNVNLVAGGNISITPDGSNNQITISTSSGAGDNLGDHTATENIKLNGNWLSGDGADEGVFVNNDGNVGIGTADPQTKLDVYTTEGLTVRGKQSNGNVGWLGGVYTGVYGEGVTGVIGIGTNVGPAIIAKNSSTGDLIQGKSAANTVVFRVNNGGTTTTKVLEITGGSDLAEPFDITGSEAITPGMVVAIDPKNPGQLRIADKAYDRSVAGIVSGANGINPGMTMRQHETVADGSLPVALTGRVYSWADASNGPIEPGDLLTTSELPGHAMKVTDYEKAHGAVLGKAMTSLKQGQGLVLVLIALH